MTIKKQITKNQARRDDQIKEIIRCGKEPLYFIKKYCKIQHPLRGTIPFKTYDFQDDCISDFQKNRLNIVLKSRQLGLSTICAAFAVWMAIFQKDKNILVIATKLQTAQNFVKKTKTIIDFLPEWLMLPKCEPSKQQLTFSNGSVIKAIPTSPDAGRSEALSLLIIDEAAFIADFDEIWTGLSPTISTGGRAIILSTPNGVGGQYYKLWVDAETRLNSFNPIRIPWNRHPEHDEEWFESETRNLTKRQISQEFLCDFVASGDTFLQADDLDWVQSTIKEPVERCGYDRTIWVWKRPEVDRKYIISADISRGDARDFSAFHIIDMQTLEIVVEYMGKIPPDDFADLLMVWGNKYNIALIVPESNSFGWSVCTKIRKQNYPRLYYQNHRGDPYTYMPLKEDEKPGFRTDSSSRLQMLSKLEELIRNKKLKMHSQRLYDQLRAFIWQNNKPIASKDSFDDLVISLAIGAYLIDGGLDVNKSSLHFAYAMLDATSVVRDSSAVSSQLSVIDEVQPISRTNNYSNYLKPRQADDVYKGRGGYKDIGWLIK
jgi:hypothetical protein